MNDTTKTSHGKKKNPVNTFLSLFGQLMQILILTFITQMCIAFGIHFFYSNLVELLALSLPEISWGIWLFALYGWQTLRILSFSPSDEENEGMPFWQKQLVKIALTFTLVGMGALILLFI